MGIVSRVKNAWNAFMNKDPTYVRGDLGFSYGMRPDRIRLSRGNEKTIVTSVYNRLALDCAAITIEHVRLDDNGRLLAPIESGINKCLTKSANIDQTGRAFIQDIVMSMFDEGCVAVIPVDTDVNPIQGTFDVYSMRTGRILEWYPEHVRVRVYNERTGRKEELLLAKESIAIIENPHYAVMNEPNSTMQRLIRKLNILDAIDEQSGAGKLDLIIQVPFAINSKRRQLQAELRRKNIEEQLADSKYGVAYSDSTERVIQLNRSVENNLMNQIEYLTTMLYSQLGITTEIMNGTADEKAMLNYYNRTIEPIVAAITDEFIRKFLTQNAISRGQSFAFFRNPFKLVPVDQVAEIADKFTRNEIMSSNEIRQVVGLKPIQDEKADELRNKNLNPGEGQEFANTSSEVKSDVAALSV